MKYQAFFVISLRFCPVISTLPHQDLALFGTSISNSMSPNMKLLRPTPTQKGKMSLALPSPEEEDEEEEEEEEEHLSICVHFF